MTYNDYKHIDTIQSNYLKLSRDPAVLQIKVVSDGSEIAFDKELVDRFGASNVILLPINSGPHLARLACISHAESDFCLFLDSDDNVCDQIPFVEGGSVHDFWGQVVGTENKKKEVGYVVGETSLRDQILKGQVSGVLWNKILPVSLLGTVPRHHLRNGEDYFTNLFLGEQLDGLKISEKAFLIYNVADGSLSKRPTKYKYRHLWKVVALLFWYRKISVLEAMKLIQLLVVRNFVRSMRDRPSLSEVGAFFCVLR